MISILLHCDIDAKDTLIAELYDLRTTGIVEHEELGGACTLEAFFDTETEAQTAMTDLAAYQPLLKSHGNRNYVAEFQAHWPPMKVGRRFWLVAPWDETPAPEDRLRLGYQAGMACGSGAHPCTQLCLEALENCVQPGLAVLDVGSGSGILLIAAHLLGATRLAGCDIDYDSVSLAHQAFPHAELFTGSTRALRDAAFDVVIANISSSAAEDLHQELCRVCRVNGVVIVSGFRVDDLPGGYRGKPSQLQGWAAIVEWQGGAGAFACP